MDKIKYNRLDFSKLKFNKKPVSSKDALSDVNPIYNREDLKIACEPTPQKKELK